MPVSVCKVSVGSYFSKAWWQNMLSKAADKFCGAKCHLFFHAGIDVIFIIKAYRIILPVNTAYSMIADSYFMRVSAEVFYYGVRSTKRNFSTHHPFFALKLSVFFHDDVNFKIKK